MIAPETRVEFFELVCAGMPLLRAAELMGVSGNTGSRWWREAGVADMRAQFGPRGLLPGSLPLSCPGQRSRRRAFSSEDRARFPAGLGAGWPYAPTGRSIG